jgi:hypothetical protein
MEIFQQSVTIITVVIFFVGFFYGYMFGRSLILGGILVVVTLTAILAWKHYSKKLHDEFQKIP